MDLYQLAAQFRRDLFDRTHAAERAVELAFRQALIEIEGEIAALQDRIRRAEAAGRPITLGWLYREGRLESLRAATAAAIARFVDKTSKGIATAQDEAIPIAEAQAARLLAMAPERLGRALARPNLEAAREMVGFLADGSPVRQALQDRAGAAMTRAQDRLVGSVLLGHGAPKAWRRLAAAAPGFRDDLGRANLSARTIARTEPIRAYSEATLESYRSFPGVVGYRRLASLSRRTCALCLGLHGKVFPLSEPFARHPNCRCTSVPVYGDGDREPQSADDWLRAQAPEVQREILGASKADAFRAGVFRLEDGVSIERDPVWGPRPRAVPLGEARPAPITERAAAPRTKSVRVAAVATPAGPPRRPTGGVRLPSPARLSAAMRQLGWDVSGVNTSFQAVVAGKRYIVKELDSTVTGLTGELLAKDVADVMGVGRLVPSYGRMTPRYLAELQRLRGSGKQFFVGEWAEGVEVAGDVLETLDDYMKIPARDRADALLLDFVIANGDRHEGNYLANPDTGRLVLIDHERAFLELGWLSPYHGIFFRDCDSDDPKEKLAFPLSVDSVRATAAAAPAIVRRARSRRLEPQRLISMRARLARIKALARFDDPMVQDLVESASQFEARRRTR